MIGVCRFGRRRVASARLRLLRRRLHCVPSGRNRKVSHVPHNFYNGTNAQVVAGSANFASLIATGFASYGLSSAQSTAFGVLNTALQAKYLAATTPATRTSAAIEGKNLALANMRRSAITLSKLIYGTPTVSDEQLVTLGLLPRPVPTPRPVPPTPPVLEVVSCSGRLVNIRLHGAAPDSTRARPFGAI